MTKRKRVVIPAPRLVNSSMASSIVVAIPPKPHQPLHFPYPQKRFGKTKPILRAFEVSWFDKWSFLHYNEANDLVICYTCVLSFNGNMLKLANADPAFVSFLSANLLFFPLYNVIILFCFLKHLRYDVCDIITKQFFYIKVNNYKKSYNQQ